MFEYNTTTISLAEPSTRPETRSYSDQLEYYNLVYRSTPLYLNVGECNSKQGWILHVSVIPMQLTLALDRLLPFLVDRAFCFKLIKNREHHHLLNIGTYGQTQIGKAISIYPETDERAIEAAQFIIDGTADLTGPLIPGDFPLSKTLSTRYGSFGDTIDTNEYGDLVRYILSPGGERMLDRCLPDPFIPFPMPFPFMSLLKEIDQSARSPILGKRCIVRKPLKKDAKGNVYKGLYIDNWGIRRCVIKEGRRNMLTSDTGRDISDRYQWERQVESELSATENVPSVFDYFKVNENCYLVSSYISHSVDFGAEVYKLIDHLAWYAVSRQKKDRILSFLEQAINAIARMHQAGYIHRDITGSNFLIKRHVKVYLIDLELTYNYKSALPAPPYKQGTIGFMSPQQQEDQPPSIADDVYSIGALILLATGMEPRRILEDDRQAVEQKLSYYLQNDTLTGLVMSCVNKDAIARPTMKVIQQEIGRYKHSLRNHVSSIPKSINRDEIEEATLSGIRGLFDEQMLHDGLWVSASLQPLNYDINPLGDKSIYGNLHCGAGGVIYFLARARAMGLLSNGRTATERTAWDYIHSRYLQKPADRVPGLHYGTSGLALLLAEVKDTSSTPPFDFSCDMITDCIDRPNNTIDLIHGIAGQGFAALRSADRLNWGFGYDIASRFARDLLASQQRDGSWYQSSDTSSQSLKPTGFGYGIAGIVYFLLSYGSKRGDAEALTAAIKGLAYLTSKSIRRKGTRFWFDDERRLGRGRWWCQGAPGISLTYLNAFETSGDAKYKLIAEQALRSIDPDFTHYNLSQCHGLSGLGEIYLEASRVLGSEEWREKAIRMANQIVTLRRREGASSCSWLVERSDFSTPSFMTGTSGVLHFLLRTLFPDKLGFPLL